MKSHMAEDLQRDSSHLLLNLSQIANCRILLKCNGEVCLYAEWSTTPWRYRSGGIAPHILNLGNR